MASVHILSGPHNLMQFQNHIKLEVAKRVLSPNLPAYKNEKVGYDVVKVCN